MNNTPETINISLDLPIESTGKRLDQALADLIPAYSRAQLQAWNKAGCILVDGKQLAGKVRVHGNEHIIINATLESKTTHKAQAIDLDIIFEDDSLLVINKPVGLVVHPAAGNPDSTLLNALLHHCPPLENLPRAGIVHRLDKDTSGIMVVAKTLTAHHHLVSELQARDIKREYETVVQGIMTAGGKVDAPIGRHPRQRIKMAVVAQGHGKPAVTHYRIIEKFLAHTHLKVMLETGRTHQIRVHMAHIKHPIVGDATYAGRLQIPKAALPQLVDTLRKFKRQALHAKRLTLIHPNTGEEMTWQAPMPKDMHQLITILRDKA